MKSRIKVKVVPSIVGSALVITDTETNKTAEAMVVQIEGAFRREGNCNGSFPHGGYQKNGDKLTLYHDGEDNDVTFTMEELKQAIEEQK